MTVVVQEHLHFLSPDFFAPHPYTHTHTSSLPFFGLPSRRARECNYLSNVAKMSASPRKCLIQKGGQKFQERNQLGGYGRRRDEPFDVTGRPGRKQSAIIKKRLK